MDDRRWRNVTCYKMMLIQKAVKQNKKKHLWFNKRVREISETHKKYFIDIYSEEISTWHVKVEAPTITLLIFKSVLLIGYKWLNSPSIVFFLLHKAIVWDYRGVIKSFDLHRKIKSLARFWSAKCDLQC